MTPFLVSVFKKNGLPLFNRLVLCTDLYASSVCMQGFILLRSLFPPSSEIQKINPESKIQHDKKLD